MKRRQGAGLDMTRDFGEVLAEYRAIHKQGECVGFGIPIPRPEGKRIPYESAESRYPMTSLSTEDEWSLLWEWWAADGDSPTTP